MPPFTKCSHSALILGVFCIAGLGTLLAMAKLRVSGLLSGAVLNN